MGDTYTLDDLEENISAKVAALDATAYRHGTDEVWTETDLPLTAVADSALEAHLAYSVSVESAPVVEDDHASEGKLTVLAQVAVVFLYRLRTDDQRRDTREGAIRAARDVAKAIMAPDVAYGSPLPVNVYQPQAMEGEFLPVRLTFQCLVDIVI